MLPSLNLIFWIAVSLKFEEPLAYYFGVTGAAMTLFSTVTGFMDLSKFASWIIENWLMLITFFWQSLLFFLPNINRVDAAILSMVAFLMLSLYRASNINQKEQSRFRSVINLLFPLVIIGFLLSIGFSNARQFETCSAECNNALKAIKAELPIDTFENIKEDFFKPNSAPETYCTFPQWVQNDLGLNSRQMILLKNLCQHQDEAVSNSQESYSTAFLNYLGWKFLYYCSPEQAIDEGEGGCGPLEDDFRANLPLLYTKYLFFVLFFATVCVTFSALQVAKRPVNIVKLSRQLWGIVICVVALFVINAGVTAFESAWLEFQA